MDYSIVIILWGKQMVKKKKKDVSLFIDIMQISTDWMLATKQKDCSESLPWKNIKYIVDRVYKSRHN